MLESHFKNPKFKNVLGGSMPQHPPGCATFPECITPTKSHAMPPQAKEPASRLRFSISINSK